MNCLGFPVKSQLTIRYKDLFWGCNSIPLIYCLAFCQWYCLFFFFSFIFISWRLITLQYCNGFCHTLIWISHGINVFPILIPPPTSLSTRSLWVFLVHQVRALVSCIQPGLVICFTLDNIHVLMLFSWSIPPSPSPTESKSLFCYLCLSFCFAYRVIVTIFLNSIDMC